MSGPKDQKRKVDVTDQPDETFRRESAESEERYEPEHRETTESNRWEGDPDASQRERGYPPEGV